MNQRRSEWLAPPRPSHDRTPRGAALKVVSKRLGRLVPPAAVAAAALAAIMLSVPGCPPPKQRHAELAPVLQAAPTIRVRVAAATKITLQTTGPYRLLADDAIVADSTRPMPPTDLARSGRHWYLGRTVHRAARLSLRPADGALVAIGKTRYRGTAQFHPQNANRILAVNHVDVESYLTGVLARELFPHWHVHAYQAQAIAARTYALYERATFGRTHAYDLRDDQSSQVYGGHPAETAKARQAVQSTRGIVLAAGPNGSERIFRAHYSSCCGGTTNSAAVLYGPPPADGPLAGGVRCRDCAASRRYRWPAVRIQKNVIFRALAPRYPKIAELGRILAVEPADNVNGRAVWLHVVGPAGRRVKLRADDLRLALLRDGPGKHLYSMNCPIRNDGDAVAFGPGRGFGHGVGMCQWGAQGMAARGCSVRQILAHYYPQSKLFQAYP